MFKKIYIEITNVCNFSCSFCFVSQRNKSIINVEEFQYITDKIKPFTQYIYLHVLGEPLLHPQLSEILQIARQQNLFVNITTNGALINKQATLLKEYPVRQLNISLHDWEENLPASTWDEQLVYICSFAKEISASTYVNFRLWNRTGSEINHFNKRCLSLMAAYFDLTEEQLFLQSKENHIRLAEHIFLQNADRFDWQHENAEKSTSHKTCYALKDHIAILSDGTIVPCCMDADAHLRLGNIFEDDLSSVLHSPKAQQIKMGFSRKEAVEDFCKSCGFR